MTPQEIDDLIDCLERNHEALGRDESPWKRAIACIRELQAELADARKTAETQCQIRYAETEEKERLQRENAELQDGIRNWSYCMDAGMRKECPEKVEELADFLIGLGIAPYSLPLR